MASKYDFIPARDECEIARRDAVKDHLRDIRERIEALLKEKRGALMYYELGLLLEVSHDTLVKVVSRYPRYFTGEPDPTRYGQYKKSPRNYVELHRDLRDWERAASGQDWNHIPGVKEMNP